MNQGRNTIQSERSGESLPKSCKQYIRIIARHKQALFATYKLSEIGIFGSYVRGEQKLRSDLDILVEFDEIPGLLEFIRLENYLSAILDKKVDLVHKKALRPQLRDAILREVQYV
jgi:uncharacterized protein